jgi:hypothetical protein
MDDRRWMRFVDGENLTIQGQKLAQSPNTELAEGRHYRRDRFLWFTEQEDPRYAVQGDWTFLRLRSWAERAYYYTTVQGSDEDLQSTRQALRELGFEPCVFKKPKGQKAKGVDISLTKDMLCHAFRDNYCPLVEELKRLGRIVIVEFFEGEGLSKELRLAADDFRALPASHLPSTNAGGS